MAKLELKQVHVALEDGTEIVKGVDLAVDPNEVHAVMGPNGSGKSTLAYALMGHPAYRITEGDVLLDGESILELEADERAQRGLFLAFQYPHAVPGVTVTSFLRSAINSVRMRVNRNTFFSMESLPQNPSTNGSSAPPRSRDAGETAMVSTPRGISAQWRPVDFSSNRHKSILGANKTSASL